MRERTSFSKDLKLVRITVLDFEDSGNFKIDLCRCCLFAVKEGGEDLIKQEK